MVLLHESVIRGHHVYKSVWSLRLGEIVSADREYGNTHDHHAVQQSLSVERESLRDLIEIAVILSVELHNAKLKLNSLV